jgi:hypothetical protein
MSCYGITCEQHLAEIAMVKTQVNPRVSVNSCLKEKGQALGQTENLHYGT